MNISQEVRHIETIETAGELGALILEAQLVKEREPLYNRKLRQSRRVVLLKKYTTSEGFDTVRIEETNEIDPHEIEHIMGIFKSVKQAKVFLRGTAKEYSLCQKLLGIEKTKRTCFSYRLGWCKGACITKEDPRLYNSRFILAFSDSKIKSWPFQGAVVIKEVSEISGQADLFLIDKWCYLGRIEESYEFEASLVNDYSFDVDTYKILQRYILSPRSAKNIHALSAARAFS